MADDAGGKLALPTSLHDKYEKRDGRILLTGVQALVRLMLIQAERDKRADLVTGGFVSGYRGSPLGTLDTAFGGAKKFTQEGRIVVLPAVNEELGATAVAGSQQIEQTPLAEVEGVFAMWYGKGPGLDRAADAVRHGNSAGSSPKGGVLLAVGDDHTAKSSTLAVNSETICAALEVPLLYPSNAHEIITYGLHGFAMSRHTGSWAALKIVSEIADATHSTPADEADLTIVYPEIEAPEAGLHVRWPCPPIEQEQRLRLHRLPAVLDYVRANRLDEIRLKPRDAAIGIVSAGKSWLDSLEALKILGLDEERLSALGVALYKVAMIWPLEPHGLGEFAEGLRTLLVVEEKGSFLEDQIKTHLYHQDRRPDIMGKRTRDGASLLNATSDLTPEQIATALAPILAEVTGDPELGERAKALNAATLGAAGLAIAPASRRPHFCSGCPHNRSTAVPDGSRASAGIGCHGLAAYFMPKTGSWAQMGGEGVHWVGLSPFTGEKHIFANLGDGTYFHSGILAIRQAVAARVNITYKLLYNSAVAMTGGQQVDGELSVESLVQQLTAENVNRITILSEDPDRYPGGAEVRKFATIGHRDDLDAAQRELREISGVSVIIYEQMCATEKRRLRKRGKLADPDLNIFINEQVCEGCGDCSAKSNCLSVEPVETALGLKRRINASSCNKDVSCVNGFCPSFVTVKGGKVRKSRTLQLTSALPAPAAFDPARKAHQRIVVAGIGGTGVVTIGALLSMTAHMSGRKAAVLDQVGMAQKGGAVTSHVHISDEEPAALRVTAGNADLVIACDQIVANAKDVMAAASLGRTRIVANADVAITGDFTQNRTAIADASLLTRRLKARVGEDSFLIAPFTRLSERLLGDAIGSNLMMIGAAWQNGWIDFSQEDFDAAVALNGQGVALNRSAFEWGRRLAVDPDSVYRAAELQAKASETLDQLVDRHSAFLADYQNQAWANRYREAIAQIQRAENQVGEHGIARAAAQSLFKLMAYKDEYEVARLYSDGQFKGRLSEQFEGPIALSFHLAPPILARRDPVTGEPRKITFGGWMMPAFKVLATLRGLRGTPLDPFGRTEERRMERRLIEDYLRLLQQIGAGLTPANASLAAAIASLALEIRGFGHVKEAALRTYEAALADRMSAFAKASAQDLKPAA